MADGGNVNIMTVMGDASMDGLSDAGSTPARSTKKVPCLRHFFSCCEMFGDGEFSKIPRPQTQL